MQITTKMRRAIGSTLLGLLTISVMTTQFLFGSATYAPVIVNATPLSADESSAHLASLETPDDADEIFRLHFTGSIEIGSMLGTRTHGTFNAAVLEQGTAVWLSGCAKYFEKDVLTFSLLDTVLSDNAALQTRDKKERIWYMAPAYHAKILADGGIDAVSLAAPHSLDYGADGLNDTMAALAEYDVAWGDSTHAVYREKNGVRVGVYTTALHLTENPEYACPVDENVLHWLANAQTGCGWTAVYLTINDTWTVEKEAIIQFAEMCADMGVNLVLLDIPSETTLSVVSRGSAQIVYGLGTFLHGGEPLADSMHSVLEVAVYSQNGTVLNWESTVLNFTEDAEDPWVILPPATSTYAETIEP